MSFPGCQLLPLPYVADIDPAAIIAGVHFASVGANEDTIYFEPITIQRLSRRILPIRPGQVTVADSRKINAPRTRCRSEVPDRNANAARCHTFAVGADVDTVPIARFVDHRMAI